MKIHSLQIKNTKRVKAVSLKPSPNGLTVIGGKNGEVQREEYRKIMKEFDFVKEVHEE